MSGAPISVRPTEVRDRDDVVALVRDAFSGDGRDGQEEVDIVRETWVRHAELHGLDLVAVADDGAIVGHVLGSSARVGDRHAVAVAPLAVAPDHQRTGVGSALMHAVIDTADADGHALVGLLGNPAYYGRFGFEPAGPLGIFYASVGADSPYFQVRRLRAHDATWTGEFVYCWEEPPAEG